jgi:hypothetical protein
MRRRRIFLVADHDQDISANSTDFLDFAMRLISLVAVVVAVTRCKKAARNRHKLNFPRCQRAKKFDLYTHIR